MEHLSLFTVALGLTIPWEVGDVQFDAKAGCIDFEVAFPRGTRFTCSHCGAEYQPVHDTRERTWRHLNFFQYQAYIHTQSSARALRVLCQDGPGWGSLGTPHEKPRSWSNSPTTLKPMGAVLTTPKTLASTCPQATVPESRNTSPQRPLPYDEFHVVHQRRSLAKVYPKDISFNFPILKSVIGSR